MLQVEQDVQKQNTFTVPIVHTATTRSFLVNHNLWACPYRPPYASIRPHIRWWISTSQDPDIVDILQLKKTFLYITVYFIHISRCVVPNIYHIYSIYFVVTVGDHFPSTVRGYWRPSEPHGMFSGDETETLSIGSAYARPGSRLRPDPGTTKIEDGKIEKCLKSGAFWDSVGRLEVSGWSETIVKWIFRSQYDA